MNWPFYILNGLLNQEEGALTENHWVCLLERSQSEILQDHFTLVYTVKQLLVQSPPPTPIVQASGLLGIWDGNGKKERLLGSDTAHSQGKIKINNGLLLFIYFFYSFSLRQNPPKLAVAFLRESTHFLKSKQSCLSQPTVDLTQPHVGSTSFQAFILSCSVPN